MRIKGLDDLQERRERERERERTSLPSKARKTRAGLRARGALTRPPSLGEEETERERER